MITKSSTREEVLEAVKQYGLNIKYAHDDLKKDKGVVLEAVKNNRWAFAYAHDDLKKDKQFVLEVVKQNGWTLQYVYESLKRDKEVVLEAVKQNGCAFGYAHDDLKPFLIAYNNLSQELNDQPNDINNSSRKIIKQCERLFVNNYDSTKTLTQVLKKTKQLIIEPGNNEVVNDYRVFTRKISKSPSAGLQLLSRLMISLSVVILGTSIAMAATSIGLITAIGFATSSVGLFAGGFSLDKRASQDNRALIKEMNDLTNKIHP